MEYSIRTSADLGLEDTHAARQHDGAIRFLGQHLRHNESAQDKEIKKTRWINTWVDRQPDIQQALAAQGWTMAT